MAVIYCPKCDSEIPENVTICPSCGFDIDTYDEDDAGSSEFNALLNAANKKLSIDAEPPDFSDDEAGGKKMSQSQIDALLSGGIVDLSGGDSKKPPKKKAAPKPAEEMPKEEPKAAEPKMPEEAQETKPAPEKTAEEPAAAEEPKPAEENTVKAPAKPKASKKAALEKDDEPINFEPAVKGNNKKISTPFIVTVIAVVVSLALGFCASLLLFGDIFHTAEESFAIKAANAVNSTLNVNEQFCVYKAYVKLGAASDECILYAITEYKEKVTASKYRVVVSKENSGIINIYYTVDENSEEYLAMKNSDDPEVRVQASILKNYSDSIEDAHREISIGMPTWKSVDISEINSNITSKQKNNASA